MRNSSSFHREKCLDAGPKLASYRTIALAMSAELAAAESCSTRLLAALYRYGARHGLPNIGADECLERLRLLPLPSLPAPSPSSLKPLGFRRIREDSWSPEEHDRAVALRQQGMSYGKIGEEIGRSYDAVAARLREYGVEVGIG